VAKKKRKVTPSNTATHKKRPLDSLDQTLINTILLEPGITDAELAERLNYKRKTINTRRHNPLFIQAIKNIQIEELEDALTIIRKAQPKAARKIIQHMDSSTEKISLAASKILINGLPEVASGVIKKEDDDTEPTEDEIAALVDYQKEIAKHKTENEG
jgi:hypothetical protein